MLGGIVFRLEAQNEMRAIVRNISMAESTVQWCLT